MGGQVVITLNKQGQDCLRSYLFIQAREIRKQTESIMVLKHILQAILFIVFDTIFMIYKGSSTKCFVTLRDQRFLNVTAKTKMQIVAIVNPDD